MSKTQQVIDKFNISIKKKFLDVKPFERVNRGVDVLHPDFDKPIVEITSQQKKQIQNLIM